MSNSIIGIKYYSVENGICIDTSGSTAGKLVQRLVQKTYNILKSMEGKQYEIRTGYYKFN